MHTGIGPFDINSGSKMGTEKSATRRRAARQLLHERPRRQRLQSADPRRELPPIGFDFQTQTYDAELTNVSTVAQRHVLSYGGNFRYNSFDLSLAPQADNRVEFGVYGQDEIFLSNHFRWVVGARIDRFDYLDDFVFSPRTTFMVKPSENQQFRVSYNRAYRSPSVINNFLDVTIVEPVNLGAFSPALAGRIYPLPIKSTGNPDLQEEKMDAFEVGHTGIVGNRATLSAAFYVNKTKNAHLLHRADQRALHGHQSAAGLAAAARGDRGSSPVPASRRTSPT